MLTQGKTDTGRLWTYVRDDGPFAGAEPLAATFYYPRDRRDEHPQAHLLAVAGIEENARREAASQKGNPAVARSPSRSRAAARRQYLCQGGYYINKSFKQLH